VTEAVVLTAIGVVIGLFLGWCVSMLVGLVFKNLPAAVPLWAAVSGIMVSAGVRRAVASFSSPSSDRRSAVDFSPSRSRRNTLGAPQPRQGLDRFPDFLPGNAEFVKALQVKPELRARAKEMAQAQGGISSNGALPIQDAGDPVRRHVESARQLRGAHAEFLEFFGQMLARMYRGHCHGALLMINGNVDA
jgi:hypothetical protein